MYEVDFLPVGDEGASGDAIAMRFSAPSGADAIVIIDAGYKDDGEALVAHVKQWYGTDHVDLAILTHPDGDHIGGMGEVLRGLDVATLCLHKIGDRGGSSLPAAEAVEELIDLADKQGTTVVEAFAGDTAFDGALTILGPSEGWYEELVAAQVEEAPERAARKATSTTSALRAAGQRILAALPLEVPFDDAGGTNPRNNSSIVTMIDIDDHRMLFTGDAGVPSLERCVDFFESGGEVWTAPDFVQIPHAGSRHNASSEFLDRWLGPKGQSVDNPAFVSVASKAKKHPSPRVVNAYKRRGYRVYETRGSTTHHSAGASDRGWPPAAQLGPMDESDED